MTDPTLLSLPKYQNGKQHKKSTFFIIIIGPKKYNKLLRSTSSKKAKVKFHKKFHSKQQQLQEGIFFLQN